MQRIALAALLLATPLACHAQQAVSLPRADGAITPAIAYEPASSAACPPLALVSPGAGGDEKGLAYLARALAADGWRAVVLGHRESGMAALRTDMRRAHGIRAGVQELVADPSAYRARFMDIDAALAWSQQRCKAPFKALLGHSMGARTVLLDAGAGNTLGIHARPRFDAYVALSPPPVDADFPAGSERSIHAPILQLTGTRDDTLARQSWQARTQPFETLGSRCAWLGVVDGASHLNFAGIGLLGKRAAQDATTTLGIAFLDALRHGACGTPPRLAGVSLRTR